MNDITRILVVDDDESIVNLMRDFLENDGFEVAAACDTNRALALFRSTPIDCILLDVMMPGQNGFELCRQIRSQSHVPILFLSARDDDVDKIRGLGLGGDDYIVKTASPAEVVARVKAVLRRYSPHSGVRETILRYGRLTIDVSARAVQVDGQDVSLTPKEFDLLHWFAQSPRQVFAYDQLLERFWGGVGDKHTVRVHIARIREKIEADPNHPKYVVNVWGVGYRFEGTPT